MTAVSLQTLHALGWTLLHFIWQGAALAGLLAAALTVSRNANVRYALGLGTLTLMLAAPAITFGWLNRPPSGVAAAEIGLNGVPSLAAGVEARLNGASSSVADVGVGLEGAPSSVAPVATGLNRASLRDGDLTTVTAADPEARFTLAAVPALERLVSKLAASTNRADMMLWLVQAWFVGVMLLSVRTAGGLFWLARTRRGEIEPLSAEMYRQCLIVQQRMGLHRNIRYGQSSSLDSPVVLGWFRPVVVVTTQALTGLSPQQLQAIIAHELAHIRRYDAFVNLFQVVAEMFLFYHPAVWWVSRRIRIEREVCCDHEALAACGEPVSYARALTMMEEWRAAPSMLMAANRGPLTERVLRLLGMQGTSARSRAAGLGACVLGVAVALFAGSLFVAAAQATADEQSPTIDQATPNDETSPMSTQAALEDETSSVLAQTTPDDETPPVIDPATPDDETSPVLAQATPEEETSRVIAEPKPKIAAAPRPVAAPKPAPAPQPAPRVQPPQPAKPAAPARPAEEARSAVQTQNKSSYIAGVAAAGLRDVSIDQLIAMKVQGITPAYIEGVMATKLHPGVDQLIALKVHGVTPDYIAQTRQLVADVSADAIVAMKVSGITPEYVRDMQAAGFDIRNADDFIAAKVQGITPELVKSAIEHGFQDLSIDKLMMLRNIDVI